MTTEEFKKLYIQYGKNSMSAAIVGIVLFFGGGIALFALSVNVYAAGGVTALGLIACLGLYKNIQHKKAIENGTNSVLKALDGENSDYIKWFYVSVLVKEKSPNIKTYSFSAYDDKKMILMLAMNDQEQSSGAMELFTSKFPQATRGFSEEIRKEMVAKYKYKFHNQQYKGLEA